MNIFMDYEITAELIQKLQQGDSQAFTELSEYYYPKAYYIALKICGNDADAKDIAQETFIQIHKSIHTLQDPKAFTKWFHRIIISKASNLFKKNKVKAISDEHAQFQLLKEERRYMNPEQQLHYASDQEVVQHFLARLDEKYRIVLVLYYFSHLKIKEISEVLDIPEGTVKSRMNVSTKILKQMIEKYQRREHTPLDFQATNIGAVITGLLLSEYESLSNVLIPTSVATSFFHRMKIPKSWISKLAIGSACVATTVCVGLIGGYVYEQGLPKMQSGELPLIDNKFSTVVYKGKEYHNAHDAYYALLALAHCKAEIDQTELSKLMEISPLYTAIKDEHGVYWDMLTYENWNIYYEQKIMK